MKCQQCQFDNEAGAKFCGNCGAALAVAGQTVTQPTSLVSQVRCPRCGKVNNAANVFCEHCGTNMSAAAQPVAPGVATVTVTDKKVSGWWWLMPIFIGWLGGLIAWMMVKDSDARTAKTLLWVGIGFSVFWFIVSIIIAVVLNVLS